MPRSPSCPLWAPGTAADVLDKRLRPEAHGYTCRVGRPGRGEDGVLGSTIGRRGRVTACVNAVYDVVTRLAQ